MQTSGRSALNFSFTSPEFLKEQNRLLPDLSYFFRGIITCFFLIVLESIFT